jgi:U6 snRNA-associated Sm-like protein LSm8
MSSNLSTFVDKLVTIITTDGRLLIGQLRGYDQTTNLILSLARERTISPDEPCSTEDLGLYILRGDNVALVGETDEEKDKSIKWYLSPLLPPNLTLSDACNQGGRSRHPYWRHKAYHVRSLRQRRTKPLPEQSDECTIRRSYEHLYLFSYASSRYRSSSQSVTASSNCLSSCSLVPPK